MANVLVEERSLQAIADAIRYKTGGADTYKPREMAPAIRNLSGTGVMQNLSVTENGNYTPPSGVDGFDSVSVAVPGGFEASDEGKVVQNGSLVPQTGLSVTANGTYDTTTRDSVIVNISGGGSWTLITPTVYNSSYISSANTLSINNPEWPDYSVIVLDLEALAGKLIRIDNTGNNRNYWGVFQSFTNGYMTLFPQARFDNVGGVLTFFADDFHNYKDNCNYLVYDFTSTAQTPPIVTVMTPPT